MTTRIYVVTVNGVTLSKSTLLVEASSAGQASRHVAKSFIDVKVATTREVADVLVAGGKLQTAVEIDNQMPLAMETVQ